MRILSADWVLPVEGEPIENGAIVIGDGVIAAVGTARELGEGERVLDLAIRANLALAEWLRGRLAEAERALVSRIAWWRSGAYMSTPSSRSSGARAPRGGSAFTSF